MQSIALPDAAKKLLRERIDNFEQLATLISLSREPERLWTDTDVARSIGVATDVAASSLEHLASNGIIEAVTARTFRYLPNAPGADALVRAYHTETVLVMKQMNQNSIDRVKGGAARTFAEAFLLGRKKDGG